MLCFIEAAHQVAPLMLGETERTLPSPRQTMMPPAWGVWARLGSQPLSQRGVVWNFDAAPIGLRANIAIQLVP